MKNEVTMPDYIIKDSFRTPDKLAFYGQEIAKVTFTAGFYFGQVAMLNRLGNTDSSQQIENDMEELRELELDQAKKEISEYFLEHDGEDIGYERLIKDLGIEPCVVVVACEELEREGKIG